MQHIKNSIHTEERALVISGLGQIHADVGHVGSSSPAYIQNNVLHWRDRRLLHTPFTPLVVAVIRYAVQVFFEFHSTLAGDLYT